MTSRPIPWYEVYPARALHEPREALPLLDRTGRRRRAVKSANRWGGVVLRITPERETKDAHDETIAAIRETVSVVYVYRPPARPAVADVDVFELRRRLHGGRRVRTRFAARPSFGG